jgi:hypothetical protein
MMAAGALRDRDRRRWDRATGRSWIDRRSGPGARVRFAAVSALGLVLVAGVVASNVRVAHASGFSTGGIFLPLGHGGRAHALGGAGVPAERSDAAAYWCPSNLAWSEQASGLTLMHAQVFPDVGSGYETVTAARRSRQPLGVGGQLLQPSRWAVGIFVAHLGLDFDTSGWSENRVQASCAVAFNNFTTLGVAARYLGLTTDFDAGDAHGGGFDLSASILLTHRVFLALVARDVFTRIRFDTGTWQTENRSYDLGVAYLAGRRIAPVGQATFGEGSLRRAGLGLEWRAWPEVLALRGGWGLVASGDTRSIPTAGAGFRFARFQLDYGASFDDEDALGVKQRVSLHVDL